ncbi:MAG: metalloregulator ArsR/SmtB family transcription factor, partial [Pseudomonadota bacterium]
LVSEEDYKKDVKKAKRFLEKESKKVVKELKNKMMVLADQEKFELAAKHRDSISAIERVLEKQAVVNASSTIWLYMMPLGQTENQSANRNQLDAVFHALADDTRRSILSSLIQGEASVTELAEPFEISQPAISRHLKVLEKAGLVERDVDQQRRPARLKADTLLSAVNWLVDFRPLWGTSFDQLDDLLRELQMHKANGDPDV